CIFHCCSFDRTSTCSMATGAALKLLKTASKCAQLVILNYECQATVEDDDVVIRDLSQAVATALDCLIENKAIDSKGLAEICANSSRKTQIDRVAFAISVLLLEFLSEREKQSPTQSTSSTLAISDETPLPSAADEDEIEITKIVNLSKKEKEMTVKKEVIDEVEKGVHPESQVDNELEPGGSGNVAGELYPEDVDDTATAIKMEEVDDPNYPQGNIDEPMEQQEMIKDALAGPEARNENNLFALVREDPNASAEVKTEEVDQSVLLIEPPVRTAAGSSQDTSTTHSMMDEANGSIPHVDHQGNDALDARANQSTSNRYAFGGALSELPPPPKKRARSAGAASLFPSVAAVKAVSSPQPSIMTNHNCSSARCAQHPSARTEQPEISEQSNGRTDALETICKWSLRQGASDADRRVAVLATLALYTNLLKMKEIAELRKEKVRVIRRYTRESVPALIKLFREAGESYQIELSPTVGTVWEMHLQLCRTKRTPLLFPVTCSNRQFGTMSASFMQVELRRAFDGAGVKDMFTLLPPTWQTAPSPSSTENSSCEVKQEDCRL
ncbi:hypothetical protein PRIPAC_88122, partial [Pristionchus pacificus]